MSHITDVLELELFTVTAVAHAVALHSTPSLSKDVVVVVVQNPLVTVTVVDHGAHVSTEGLIHAVGLDAVPCWVRGGQGRVSGTHGETRVRGPVTCHLFYSLLITARRQSNGATRDRGTPKRTFCGNGQSIVHRYFFHKGQLS